LQRTLFSLGTLAIPSFSALAGLGVLLAFLVTMRLSRSKNLDRLELTSYYIFLALAFWLGAKLYPLITRIFLDPRQFFDGRFNFRTFLLKGATSVIGGISGAIIFSAIYLKRIRFPFWLTMDLVAAGVPLGQAVGRIGCFLGGCCYGRPTDLFWGVTFPGLPGSVHPTQLYESALNLGNFFVLLTLRKKQIFEGQIFVVYILNYSTIRFFIEFWRGDSRRIAFIPSSLPWLALSLPQVISLIGFMAGLLMWQRRGRKAQELEKRRES
jgi:phosphatidylglycerol:prolipoprotein diacylglycerol transferase